MNIMLALLKKSSGIKPKGISPRDKNQNIQKTIREIVKSYENDPSILEIKNICSSSFHVKEKICFHFVNEIEIKKLIHGLNSKKNYWNRHTSPKTTKSSCGFFDSTLN